MFIFVHHIHHLEKHPIHQNTKTQNMGLLYFISNNLPYYLLSGDWHALVHSSSWKLISGPIYVCYLILFLHYTLPFTSLCDWSKITLRVNLSYSEVWACFIANDSSSGDARLIEGIFIHYGWVCMMDIQLALLDFHHQSTAWEARFKDMHPTTKKDCIKSHLCFRNLQKASAQQCLSRISAQDFSEYYTKVLCYVKCALIFIFYWDLHLIKKQYQFQTMLQHIKMCI